MYQLISHESDPHFHHEANILCVFPINMKMTKMYFINITWFVRGLIKKVSDLILSIKTNEVCESTSIGRLRMPSCTCVTFLTRREHQSQPLSEGMNSTLLDSHFPWNNVMTWTYYTSTWWYSSETVRRFSRLSQIKVWYNIFEIINPVWNKPLWA